MPIYEFICPVHGKFEKIVKVGQQVALCEETVGLESPPEDCSYRYCGQLSKRVTAEVPAKRDPRYGIG